MAEKKATKKKTTKKAKAVEVMSEEPMAITSVSIANTASTWHSVLGPVNVSQNTKLQFVNKAVDWAVYACQGGDAPTEPEMSARAYECANIARLVYGPVNNNYDIAQVKQLIIAAKSKFIQTHA